MTRTRRSFIRLGSAAGAAMAAARVGAGVRQENASTAQVAQALGAPVLRGELFTSPVLISSIDVIKAGDQFLVRVRSSDGASGIAVGHPDVLETTWPILTRRIAPFFIKKDARELEKWLEDIYIANSNYKWQGLPFWVPLASLEFAILDLLGQVSRKPLGELFGPVVRRDVAVYRASGNRGNVRSRDCVSAASKECSGCPPAPVSESRLIRRSSRRARGCPDWGRRDHVAARVLAHRAKRSTRPISGTAAEHL